MPIWPRSWQKRVFTWVDRRAPNGRTHLLQRDKLYIFPTATGFLFSALVAVLWMLGTNYQNNLILALSLLLASLFILAILRTHGNLSGLEIHFHDADESYVGQEVAFHFDIINRARRHSDSVYLRWQGQVPTVVALEAQDRKRVPVCAFPTQRGYLRPGRLRVESVYPLGLLRCWSWLNFDACAVIYPEPRKLLTLNLDGRTEDGGDACGDAGTDEFHGFRQYRVGDPLKQIAWKQYARDQGLLSKEFESSQGRDVWLTWDNSGRLADEQKLSNLCFWVRHYDHLGCRYGLELPGFRLEPSAGDHHRREALTALALYGRGGR